jgi:hypothetical protein
MNMQNEFAVSLQMLQFEGCRLARKHNVSISEFKVSYGWVRYFMARHKFVIRCQMMIEQRLPEACEEKVVGFHKFVLKL